MVPVDWHGTIAGYKEHICRCDLCRKANSINYRKLLKQRKRTKHEGHTRFYTAVPPTIFSR